MTRASGVGGIRAGNPVTARGRKRVGGPAFRVDQGETATAVDGVCGTETVTATFLIGLQESGRDAARDEAAQTRLREVLAELARLQHDLLRGGIGRATLARLAHAAQALPEPADPVLRDLLAAGVLRLRIELARYDALALRPGD